MRSRPFLLALAASAGLLLATAALADLREVDRKILEYSPGAAREALDRAGASEYERLIAEGRILALENKTGEAQDRLRRATEVRGDDPAAWVYLGEVRQRADDQGGAREAYRRAEELARQRVDGGGAEARYYLGRALAGTGNLDAAAEQLRQADGYGAVAQLHLGITLAQQERWQEATDALTRALERDSGIAYAYYYRGLANSKLGRKDQLINDLDRFLALAPDAPEADRARRIIQSAKR